MLLVVERDLGGVQTQKVADLVAHVVANSLVLPVLEPHLDQALLGAQAHAGSDDARLLELLADECKEHGLPHLVDVVVLLDLDDPHAAVRGLFPHRHLRVAEEEDVDLAGHLARLLQVHVVVEEVLDRRNLAERLQLVLVRNLPEPLLLLLHDGRCNLGILTLSYASERIRPLEIPELPVAVEGVRLCGLGDRLLVSNEQVLLSYFRCA